MTHLWMMARRRATVSRTSCELWKSTVSNVSKLAGTRRRSWHGSAWTSSDSTRSGVDGMPSWSSSLQSAWAWKRLTCLACRSSATSGTRSSRTLMLARTSCRRSSQPDISKSTRHTWRSSEEKWSRGHRGGAAISSTCGRSRRPWQKCGSTQRLRRQRFRQTSWKQESTTNGRRSVKPGLRLWRSSSCTSSSLRWGACSSGSRPPAKSSGAVARQRWSACCSDIKT
mmetsp:Transcript_98588/g.136792  ORF Transcript_98588/g.136792 Transcript_98588/m.136792 type:complete len:226 (-) Transcript_98588:222-899(-)